MSLDPMGKMKLISISGQAAARVFPYKLARGLQNLKDKSTAAQRSHPINLAQMGKKGLPLLGAFYCSLGSHSLARRSAPAEQRQ
jgi:hypothetical protein